MIRTVPIYWRPTRSLLIQHKNLTQTTHSVLYMVRMAMLVYFCPVVGFFFSPTASLSLGLVPFTGRPPEQLGALRPTVVTVSRPVSIFLRVLTGFFVFCGLPARRFGSLPQLIALL